VVVLGTFGRAIERVSGCWWLLRAVASNGPGRPYRDGGNNVAPRRWVTWYVYISDVWERNLKLDLLLDLEEDRWRIIV
jgi:hypothetical protein